MDNLELFGWNDHFSNYDTKHGNTGEFHIGRVTSVRGFKYHLATREGELEAELAGKLLFGTENELLPRVGDWVYYLDYETEGYIVEVLPRMNELSRKNPGNRTEKQVLASNIDFALIVQGMDRDFNLMRLDRMLVQLAACRIRAVIILNKADLVDDPERYLREVSRLGRDCPVFPISVLEKTGLNDLYARVLKPGMTYILIGSSGVGKSSLVNVLMNHSLQRTAHISDSTRKGVHMTTTRDLFVLPNGSLLIDSPGMREFGLAMEEEVTTSMFPLLDVWAAECRFTDCKHLNEDGCAVIAACESGKLDPKIYGSYVKLLKEQRRFEVKAEDKKRLGKQFGKMSREATAFRKKYKY